jgi:protease Do-like 1, chloroplastic
MPDFDYHDQRRPHRPSPWTILLPLVFVTGAVLLILWATGVFSGHRALHDPNAQPREVAATIDPDALEQERIRVFQDTKECVVNVDTIFVQRAAFDLNVTERLYGTGSGFIWKKEGGYVVTNFHVVQPALRGDDHLQIRVTLADRSSWNARVVGLAPDNDLAVLQIDAPKDHLKEIPVSTSANLLVGQTVFAIGNPFGQSLTMTSGIVSALDREIQSVTDQPITGVIQTDAALNPGNSGGPLLNRAGQLIGVNTAIASPSGGSVGIGFAIPVDTVQRVVPDLIRTGRTARPVIGIVALRDQYTRKLGIDKGIMIQEVRPNGPAAKAGLLGVHTNPRTGERDFGDIILAIDNTPVNTFADLNRVMSKYKPGDTVTLKVQRGDDVTDVKVTLEGV